ncbi:hypothetical protein [Microbacterium resistens]|uniref:hypothetical protein n=1 Tax=Microbacterium resistens TaxID=156977 RepID=UPI0008367D9E|nr:hypothetical protein [Microbacterium resistens]
MSDSPDAVPSVADDLVGEFLARSAHGARLIAVAGADADRVTAFATRLAEAFAGRDVVADVSDATGKDEAALRTEVVAPYRASRVDAVRIVTGDAGLLIPSARGLWHQSIWVLAGDEPPHTAADALVDLTDPGRPTRRFGDYCAVPPDHLS